MGILAIRSRYEPVPDAKDPWDRTTSEIDASRPHAARAQARPMEDFVQLTFDGLEIVDPGVEVVSDWRSEAAGPRPSAIDVSDYGGVAASRNGLVVRLATLAG
jgi:hypothetical protein